MNYKKIFMGLGLVSIVTLPSCEKIKDFKDTNLDPNNTTTPIPSALLTNVEANLGANLVFDAGGMNTGAGLYSQLFAETQYTEVSRFAGTNYNYDAYFAGPLYDLQNIINYNSDPATAATAATFGSNNNQIAIARILKAQYIKQITDMVGDIPYFGAFKGTTGQTTPVYDKQQAIYADLLKELKEAVAQFDNGATVQGDIIFNGNTDKWKKYANTLRFLLGLNMGKVDANTAKSEMAAALAGGVISSNSDNVTVNYVGGNFPNPFYNYYNITKRSDFALSKTVTDQLSTLGDPRLNVYGSSNVGFPYGLTRDQAVAFANANPTYARLLNSTYRATNSPLVIMPAAAVTLARAEAAQRGLTTENAASLYSSGIQLSWQQWNVFDAGAFATYMANANVALGTDNLKKIATQEWLAWFPNGVEAYNVYRRTGFPALTAPTGTTGIPRRTPYGTNDYAYNSANVNAAAAGYTVNGIADSPYARVWWDVQ